jgi:hypothetical protein
MSTAKPPIWVLVKAHLFADARKTAILAVLGVIMAGVYGRFLLHAPQSAAADTIVAVAVPGAASQPAGLRSERVAVSQPLTRDLPSDPFALDVEKYPRSRTGSAGPEVRGRADEKIRAEAASLALQSTLFGKIPVACISGQFLRTGDRISGFVLKQVEPRRVILEREGVQVALYLK